MKFKANINKSIVDSNGVVHITEGDLKKIVEDCAEKAHDLGKVKGWVLGGIFVGGVIMAIDAAVQFLSNDDHNQTK